MSTWIRTEDALPEEGEEVWVRVRGNVRPRYYRIDGRWYALIDLDRWQMNTSPYWNADRSWFLKIDEVEAWRPLGEDEA